MSKKLITSPTRPSKRIIDEKISDAMDYMRDEACELVQSGSVGCIFRPFDGGDDRIVTGKIGSGDTLPWNEAFDCESFGLGKARLALRVRGASDTLENLKKRFGDGFELLEGESPAQGAIFISSAEGDYAFYASGFPGGYMDSLIASTAFQAMYSDAERKNALIGYIAALASQRA